MNSDKLFAVMLLLIGTCCYRSYGQKCSIDSITRTLKNYAEGYTISKNRHVVPDIPAVDGKIKTALVCWNQQNITIADKYIMLVALKVYKEQIKYYKQTYNIATDLNNPLTLSVLKILNMCKTEKVGSSELECDYISSYYIYKWAKENSEKLNYKPINIQLKEIENLRIKNQCNSLAIVKYDRHLIEDGD